MADAGRCEQVQCHHMRMQKVLGLFVGGELPVGDAVVEHEGYQ